MDKFKLIVSLVSMIFDDSTLEESEIENLKQSEALELALNTLSKEFPQLTEVLVHERDQVLSLK